MLCLSDCIDFLCAHSTDLCFRVFVSIFQSLYICLFEFGKGSSVKSKTGQQFSWGWGGYSGGGSVRKGVVFRNLGLFGQRCSVYSM